MPGDGQLLVHAEAQIMPMDFGNLPVGVQSRETRWRGRPADNDQTAFWRDFLTGQRQQSADLGIAHILKIIQHQQGGFIQTLKQFTKIMAGELRQALPIFGGQGRHFPAPAPHSRRLAQVVKKGCRVPVAGIHLIPKMPTVSGFDVAGDQGGLAGACRRIDPYERIVARRIQFFEQAFTYNGRTRIRPGKFCQLQRHPSITSGVLVFLSGFSVFHCLD